MSLMIKKRSGEVVPFKMYKVANAIESAMAETEAGIDNDMAIEIATDIEEEISELDYYLGVEDVQDLVEEHLMRSDRKDVAKRYIIYREERNQKRDKVWEMNDLQRDIFKNKYEFNNEGFTGFLDRVSDGHSGIRKAMKEKMLLPAGRILAGKGLYKHGIKNSYSNCFVIGNPEDNLESIFDTSKKMARTYSYGGGCGTCLGNLRPSGAKVNNSAKETTGTVSFAELYSTTTGIIGQRNRRGALMLSLPVKHPDIYNFINAKANTDQITKANISVKIDNEFMEAVKNNEQYELFFKVEDTGEEIRQTVDANELMDLISKNANDWGEPGVLFWDRVEDYHINSELEDFKYDSTNPCGEKPLPKGGSCLLLSINFSELIKYAFTKEAGVDYDLLWDLTAQAVVYLDDVLEEGLQFLPLEEQRKTVSDYRQLGIGIMGLADAFIKLGVKYGSEESLKVSHIAGHIMINSALQQSALLAKEKGSYPKFDKDAVLNSKFIKTVATQETIGMIEEYGLRNAELLSVAPTGSLSSLFGVSGGIEPIYNISYTRKSETLSGEGDTYYKVYTPIVREYMDANNIDKEEDLPDFFVTAMTLNSEDRIKFQGVWQRYIDSAISSTINLPNSATYEDVKNIYIKSYDEGLKGVTVFRDGCKRMGILTNDTPTEQVDTDKMSVDELQEALDKAVMSELASDPSKCPMCKGALKVENGCSTCLDCGYSPCSL